MSAVTAQTVMLISVADLALGDDYRLDDDPEAVDELAASITEFGLLQPLLVRPVNNGYEVVAGRRRLAASRLAGMERVPCAVRAMTGDEALDVALVENLHRRELSPIEVALALARMRDEQGLTQVAIAERIRRSQFYVSVILRLLEMPKRIQNKVHAGKMSYSTAYDHWKREPRGTRQGGKANRAAGDDPEFRAVSHWRRRHDRLLAGIYQVLKCRQATAVAQRPMLERLLKVDKQPLPEEEPSANGRRRHLVGVPS